MAPVSGWDILGSKWTCRHVPKVDVLESGKMGKNKDLNEFDKGHTVMARWLGKSISRTAALVGCFQSAVFSIFCYLSHLVLLLLECLKYFLITLAWIHTLSPNHHWHANQHYEMYQVWMDVKYVGWYLLTTFLKPKYAPMKVSGTEIQNQSAKMATRVPNGMAAEDPSPHRIKFITKKSANTTLSIDSDDDRWWTRRMRSSSSYCLWVCICVHY